MNNNSGIILSDMLGGIVKKREADSILKCNSDTSEYGLILTEEQALALADTRANTLSKTNRVEFGDGITAKLIKNFADSPYITNANYEAVLHELIESFYHFKNETHDILSDDELISFMKSEFNGICGGSVELLNSRSLVILTEHINSGKKSNNI